MILEDLVEQHNGFVEATKGKAGLEQCVLDAKPLLLCDLIPTSCLAQDLPNVSRFKGRLSLFRLHDAGWARG